MLRGYCSLTLRCFICLIKYFVLTYLFSYTHHALFMSLLVNVQNEFEISDAPIATATNSLKN